MTTEASSTASTSTATSATEQPERVSTQIGRGLSGAVDFNYNNSEAAPGEATQQGEAGTTAEEKPLILGKFKTPEDLEKAYKELETKLGQPKASSEEGKAGEEKPSADDTSKQAEDSKDEPKKADDSEQTKIEEAVTNLDPTVYEQEFMEKGVLSEDSYADLAKRGIPKDLVDDVIALRLQKAESIKTSFYEAAGGEDNLNSILEWARSDEAIKNTVGKAYDAQIDKAKSPEEVTLAITGLRAQYEAANGVKQSRVVGAEGSVSGVVAAQGYATEGDWRIDVRSERYKTDASFRRVVNSRLAASSWFDQ